MFFMNLAHACAKVELQIWPSQKSSEKKYYKRLQDITKADDTRHICKQFCRELFLSNIAWAHISIWIL